MRPQRDIFEEISNPLDNIEEILTGNGWSFTRTADDEMIVTISCAKGTYTMNFCWQEEFMAMQVSCDYDLEIPAARLTETCVALRTINDDVWLGHFELPASRMPRFRHTSLFRGFVHTSGAEYLADLVEIATTECERHHDVFRMLSTSQKMDDAILSFIIKEAAGVA